MSINPRSSSLTDIEIEPLTPSTAPSSPLSEPPPTFASLIKAPVLPDVHEQHVKTAMFDLLRGSRAAPTYEAMYQSHLFKALSLPIVHLVEDTASFASLESGYDLDMVRVRDSPTYEETSVYLKLMDWTAEGRGIAVSDVSAKLGVRQPDISTCVFLELEGETYNLVSMILEIKPSPGNQENA